MENYSLESLPTPDPKKQRLTRILLIVWLGLGLIIAAILCYILSAAFRPAPKLPLYVGDLDEYPADSVSKEFVNAKFFDETANKEIETLPLQVVRGAGQDFTVFFARSTNPAQAILIPRQCIVEWEDSLAQFLELCAGSRWTRDGKYAAGPAPRDLDKFPAHVENGKLYIDLELEKGAAHP
ncbi:MAG: hypothetical protein HY741_17465 [Chloroflexi bacterium]|nr:hypothetical protein [Chloroflexota bacterium]